MKLADGESDANIALLQRAMKLLYHTCIQGTNSTERAAKRGEAIRAIDALILLEGGKSFAQEEAVRRAFG